MKEYFGLFKHEKELAKLLKKVKMLDLKDKKEMLADAKNLRRRNAFRKNKNTQEGKPLRGADYLDFLNAIKSINQVKARFRRSKGSDIFIL